MEVRPKLVSLRCVVILVTWTACMCIITGTWHLSNFLDLPHKYSLAIQLNSRHDDQTAIKSEDWSVEEEQPIKDAQQYFFIPVEAEAKLSSNDNTPGEQRPRVAQTQIQTQTQTQTQTQPRPFFRDLLNRTYSTQLLQWPDHVANASRYLIYRCDTSTMRVCGGWADRVRGMMAAYLIANLTGRVFKVEFILPPCDIQRYVIPNHVNWSLPVSFHKVIHRSPDVQILSKVDNYAFYHSVKNLNFSSLSAMRAQYVYYKSNLDYMLGFQKSTYHRHELSWMRNLTDDQINAAVFKRLFKLTPELQGKLDAFLSQSVAPDDKLICAHIRTGRNPTLPNDTDVRIKATDFHKIWEFLHHVSTAQKSKIFIMTDSEQVIADSKRQIFRDRLLFSPGNIVHVERSYGATVQAKCAALEKVIIDQFVLMHCDVLMISKSGLGRMAAYVRGSDEGLYCLTRGAVIAPCKRMDVKALFKIHG